METIEIHITISSENFNRKYVKTFKGKKANEESINYLKRLHSLQLNKASLKANLGPFKSSFLAKEKESWHRYKNQRAAGKLMEQNNYSIQVETKTIQSEKQNKLF
jgi:hypothetical protein